MDERKIGVSNRQQFYQQFIILVSTKPKAEEDALLKAGETVFAYRLATAREDVEKRRGSGASSSKAATTFIDDDLIVEIIRVPGEPQPVKYLMYHLDGHTEQVDSLQVGPTMLFPPQSPLFDKNKILLATGTEEYGKPEYVDEEGVRHESTLGRQRGLFDSIQDFVRDYVQIENVNFQSVVVFYAFLTWIYDKFDTVPYLRAIGDYGVGKSRLLQVLQSISYRSLMVGGSLTAAPIYRVIEQCGVTLVLDESDFSKSDLATDITQILNSGYQRGFGVLRTERSHAGPFETDYYETYGPKILASRKRWQDEALESRCFSYTMVPLRTEQIRQSIPYILDAEFRERAQSLRNQLLLWRFRHWRQASVDSRARFPGLDPRLNQIVLPLLSVADDDAMRAMILEQIRSYQGALQEDRRESPEGIIADALIQMLKRSFGKATLGGKIMVKQLVEHLNDQQTGTEKMSNRAVTGIVRHTFDLKTSRINGVTWAHATVDDVRRLARRYGLVDREAVIGDTAIPAPDVPTQPVIVSRTRQAFTE